jgi:hypothetical protein
MGRAPRARALCARAPYARAFWPISMCSGDGWEGKYNKRLAKLILNVMTAINTNKQASEKWHYQTENIESPIG